MKIYSNIDTHNLNDEDYEKYELAMAYYGNEEDAEKYYKDVIVYPDPDDTEKTTKLIIDKNYDSLKDIPIYDLKQYMNFDKLLNDIIDSMSDEELFKYINHYKFVEVMKHRPDFIYMDGKLAQMV